MKSQWIQSKKFKGVRWRQHPARKHGIQFDRYYALRYQDDGKRIEEGLGWASDAEHWTEEKAGLKLSELKSKGLRLSDERRIEQQTRAAEEARDKAELEANKTLSEYWKESYFPAAQRSKKANSWCKEETHFRLWIEPLFGKLPLRSIGLKQWDELVKTLSAKGLSPRSKEYICGTLRRILKHAYDRRLVDDSPPSGKRIGVTGPGNNRRLRVISHEEEAAIMENLSVTDMHAWRITRFCFLTGCRASEAFSLTWQNLDFNQGNIVFAETKNHDPRTIPLTCSLIELFDSMEPGSPGQLVFTKKDRSPYLEAPNAFRTAVDNIGLNDGRSKRDKLVFHSIRHTVATRLAQRLGPRDLMDVMGWRTVQMAMRYIHGNEDAKMKALNMLGAPGTAKVLPFVRAAENKG